VCGVCGGWNGQKSYVDIRTAIGTVRIASNHAGGDR
jgi:hypothetical protein